MFLAEKKGCWLGDLADVPAAEIPLWVAHYELQAEGERRVAREAEKATRGGRVGRRGRRR